MNRLFRVLASCLLAVLVVLGGVSIVSTAPAHAQSSDIRIEFNSPTRLTKGLKYFIPAGETTEIPNLVQFQNTNTGYSAKVAFFYGSEPSLKDIPPSTRKPIDAFYTFNGSRVTIQNVSQENNNDVSVTIVGNQK